MNKAVFLAECIDKKVFVEGHFEGKSGRHFGVYIEKLEILPWVGLVQWVGAEFVKAFGHLEIDAVIAPALGGIALSQWTAHLFEMATGKAIAALYAKKESDDRFSIELPFHKHIEGKKVLVVEDTGTTGGSAAEVIDQVQACGGTVVGVGMIFNRGHVGPDELRGVKNVFSIFDFSDDPDFISYNPSYCPQCLQGIYVNQNIGHGGGK